MEAAPEPAFSLRHHPPLRLPTLRISAQKIICSPLGEMRAAHLLPGTPPACAAHASRTRVNCRGLLAATAPLGPEDALAEAQPRRPWIGRTLCSRSIRAAPLQPGAGRTACGEGDRPQRVADPATRRALTTQHRRARASAPRPPGDPRALFNPGSE